MDTVIFHLTEHGALLPTGKVLMWGFRGDTAPMIWDPATNTARRIPGPDSQNVIFHAGTIGLPDGRLAMIGGVLANNVDVAHDVPRTYDPVAPAGRSPWGILGGHLLTPRFYPTTVPLATGQILVASGDYVSTPGLPPSQGRSAEIYDPAQNKWVPVVDQSAPNKRLMSVDVFPTMYQLPSGKIIYLPEADDFSGRGAAPALLDLDGPRVTSDVFGPITVDGQTVAAPSTTRGWQPIPLALDRRPQGGSVLLVDDTGATPTTRILAVGGSLFSAELIDVTDELHPTVARSELTFNRDDHAGVVALPDGSVLVLDGSAQSPLPPELFRNGRWTQAGPTPLFKRDHHGTAVLVPDGRIICGADEAGSGLEVFSPDYVASRARPAITASPATARAGTTITLTASVAPTKVASVSLIRAATISHATNPGNRFVKLAVTRTNGALSVRIPIATIAPPGDYLLFVVDDKGIPSVGKFLRVQL